MIRGRGANPAVEDVLELSARPQARARWALAMALTWPWARGPAPESRLTGGLRRRDRQALAALGAAALQDEPPVLRAHAHQNPWVRLRRRRFGWNVRFMISIPLVDPLQRLE